MSILLALLLQAELTPETVPLPPGHVRYGTPLTPDMLVPGWETFPPRVPLSSACNPVDEALVFPVTREARAEAISMLSEVSIRALGEEETFRLTGVAPAAVARDLSAHRPYLVRAAARLQDEYPGLPAYFAAVCGRDLHVVSLVFSYTIPPSARAPAVLYLTARPQRVHAWAEVAW